MKISCKLIDLKTLKDQVCARSETIHSSWCTGKLHGLFEISVSVELLLAVF